LNFKEQLTTKIEEIEKILKRYLPKEEGPQKTVIEAMNYSVLAGGKRLRPMLMNETFRLFGGSGNIVEPFMTAIEMIHTYSLVHDDLPAMDNDEYRRGKKTTHAVYGETMGILAGDGLLNYAFEIASGAFDIELSPGVSKALKILSQKSGIYGMIGGQVVDIESEGKSVSFETVEFIHRMKCGALIEASMLIGAVLAGANDEEQQKIYEIASDVGYAFQIRDDILDATATTEQIGKPAGSDEKNNKSTYVSIKGLEKAMEDVKAISEHALGLLESLGKTNPFLTELIKMLVDREK